MTELLLQVESAIQQRGLFKKGERILVAVSGGVDSMVLLHLLGQLAASHKWKLTVAHLNHQLRGRSSDADERLVARTAKEMAVPFVSERADVRSHAAATGVSTEMAARQLRHDFLVRAARSIGSRKIALAHHADDQVELFFLRLLRGTGPEGLAGMKWTSPSPSSRGERIILARPLLASSREQIEQYATDNGIAFRHDASNDALDILRNRVRHELLPLLEKHYQPATRRVVLRLMDILAAETELSSALVEEWLLRSAPREGTRPTSEAGFEELPVAAQRRLLQLQLVKLGIRPDYEAIESLRTSLKPLAIAPQTSLVRDSKGRVHRQSIEPVDFVKDQQMIHLSPSGSATFGGLETQWTVKAAPPTKKSAKLAGRELFDAKKVGNRIMLRHWRPGDRFQAIGMRSAVKLQDFFVNQKVPRALRHQLVVAATEDGDIFWIEGMRISDRFKLDAGTTQRLEWRWRRIYAAKAP